MLIPSIQCAELIVSYTHLTDGHVERNAIVLTARAIDIVVMKGSKFDSILYHKVLDHNLRQSRDQYTERREVQIRRPAVTPHLIRRYHRAAGWGLYTTRASNFTAHDVDLKLIGLLCPIAAASSA